MGRNIIIFRHGERRDEINDSPITQEGERTVVEQSKTLIDTELNPKRIDQIDIALVSGSVRCAHTFTIIWRELLKKGIAIGKVDMDLRYCSLPEEDIEWETLQNNEIFKTELAEFGEKRTLMTYVPHLVRAIVERTVAAIPPKAKTVLIVTHGIVDSLLAKQFTGQDRDPLEMGHAWVIECE